MNTIILSGSDKGRSIDVRPMTVAEVKSLQRGNHCLCFTGSFGRNRLTGLVHVKINGKPKTWKTRPADATIPIKYGLHEYARIEYIDGAPADNNIYLVTEA